MKSYIYEKVVFKQQKIIYVRVYIYVSAHEYITLCCIFMLDKHIVHI